MKNINEKTKQLIYGAMIAAAYAGLSLFLLPAAFGPVQVRISEGLSILPLYFPSAVPGLVIGCMIVNLFSPYGIIDVIFGSLATLISALCVRLFGKRVRSTLLRALICPLFPVISNGLIIGAVLYFSAASRSGLPAYLMLSGQIALQEAASAYLIGVPVMLILDKRRP